MAALPSSPVEVKSAMSAASMSTHGSTDSELVYQYDEYMHDICSARVKTTRPAANGFVACECAGDGDCQFSAIAQALNAYSGSECAALAAHLNTMKLTHGKLAALDLRELVYALFLVDTPLLLPYLEHWKRQPAEGTNAASAFLQHRRLDTLTHTDRSALFTALMRKSSCWGDDVSLALLERVLRVRIDVFTPTGALIKREEEFAPDFIPFVFVSLQLTMMHYETLAVAVSSSGSIAAWSANELPRVIIDANRALYAAGDKFRSTFDAWVGDAGIVRREPAVHSDDVTAALVDAALSALFDYHTQADAARKRRRPLTPLHRAAWTYSMDGEYDGGSGYISPPVSPTVGADWHTGPFTGDGDARRGAAVDRRVDADGGRQWMGTVALQHVAFLQCGARVFSK